MPEHDPFWLGRALVETKAITEEQFASARQFWRKNPRESFAAVLEILGLVSPLPLAGLIAQHHRLPAAALGARTLDRAAARLIPPAVARQKCLLPFRQDHRRLHVAIADPAVYGPPQARKDFPDHDVSLHVAPRGDILGLIEEAWRPAATAAVNANELFENLIREAVAERATDLHLEPRDSSLDVRQRIDGRLVHKCFFDQALRESIVQAAKIAGHMDIAERRLPQDGQGSFASGSRSYRLRFSCIPAVNGESIVVRLIDERAGVRSFEEMGFFAADIARLHEILRLPHGLVYVTGPTGAGKTTLLYSMLNNLPPEEINERKIVTLEEPVEVRNPRFFLQVAVDERIGRTFGELLRHVLRHDPDVILVGETRDLPTAEITLRASLTGRLCFSTLHTNSALGAVARLTEVGLDPLMLASALKAVIAQRLVRRPCPRCRRPHPQNDLLLSRFRALLSEEIGEEKPVGFFTAPRGADCAVCRGRGYQGRTAIVEIFPLGGLDRLIAERSPPAAFMAPLRLRGCRTLFEDGVRKAALGLTTLEEVYGAVEDLAQPPAFAPGLLLSPQPPAPEETPAMNQPKNAEAFTLVETLAVLAVIAAIIAIGVPAISKVLQSSRVRNAEGTASVIKSALTQYLGKPGSLGTLPVTEGSVPASEYVATGTILTAGTIANAATLDNILLAEGVLDRPLTLRMGGQNFAPSGVAPTWTPALSQFTGPASGTLASYANATRVECSVSDAISNPGVTGQSLGSAACAFSLSGSAGTLIPSGSRVAYLIIKSVPDADAYQLALDVDGLNLVQNTLAAPAANDQSQGPVAYARDAGLTGFVDVYYYLASI